MLWSLPPELLSEIFSYLEGKDVKKLIYLGFHPALFTYLTSRKTKFIDSTVLNKFVHLRKVEGYIFIYKYSRIVPNCIYYLKSFSFPFISPFFRQDAILINTSYARCKLLQRKGDFYLIYNYKNFLRYIEKEFPYISKERNIIIAGKECLKKAEERVKIKPHLRKYVDNLEITTFSHLCSLVCKLIQCGSKLEEFPKLFFKELALLYMKKSLGTNLTSQDINLLARCFCEELDPIDQALLYILR